MEYKGKQIYSEDPSVADPYRQAYIDGIESFIADLQNKAADARQSFISADALKADPEYFRLKYKEMLGLTRLGNEKPVVESKRVGEDDVSEIYRLTVTALGIPLYAMLLVPKDASKPTPLVIAQHGGGGTPELCSDFYGKNNYNHMVRRLLERGATVVVPQLLLWARTESATARGHAIPFDRSQIDYKLKHLGITMTGLEVFMLMKCIDYALTLDGINPEKLGMMGLSYGGYMTLHTMAADTRIKVGYSAGVFNDRMIYDNKKDFVYFGSAYTFHDAEIAALCAPRRLFVQVGKADTVFDYRHALPEIERARGYFEALGCSKCFKSSVWEGGHTVSDDDVGYDFLFDTFN